MINISSNDSRGRKSLVKLNRSFFTVFYAFDSFLALNENKVKENTKTFNPNFWNDNIKDGTLSYDVKKIASNILMSFH